MTSLFVFLAFALSLAAAPAVPSGSAGEIQQDHVLIAQLGPGDVTSPIGQTSANTTSGGMGGLDRSDALGGSQGGLNTGGAEASGATSTTGSTSAVGSPSAAGSTTTRSPSGSSGGLGTTGNTGLTGGTSGTGLGGTSTSTGLGSTTGGMR